MGGAGLSDVLITPIEAEVAESEFVEIQEGQGEDAQPTKLLPDPDQPSAADVERHRCGSHTPCRP